MLHQYVEKKKKKSHIKRKKKKRQSTHRYIGSYKNYRKKTLLEIKQLS